jgi:hypothetical protein
MAGICRHYCCGLACIGANTFCDIEPVFQEEQLVPVCASGPPCALLGSDCTRGENCTVVNASTGQTACVTPGTGVLDGDCTKEKCGANLACIDNTCKELCSGTTECPSGRMCVPLTALGGGIGICTK